ncbi:hypothetical protein BDW22DRAFT_1355185 [Trametopsis cervina]|nr:hypothetical protein BDW22DRAFT_1355185 [Trametopsis cervina]
MATNEHPEASDKIEEEGANRTQVVLGGTQGSEGSTTKADSALTADKPASSSKDVSPSRQDSSAGSASARGMPLNGSTSGTTLSMPHPKKFSHIDINKRFLEKTSAASTIGHPSSPSATNKPGLSTQKPATQSTLSHSRLVTTKLTTEIQRSSTTGPGWSRPPSTSSPTTATPSVPSPAPKVVSTPASNHAAPQLPVAGKVIQPQPRGAAEAVPLLRKASSGKPAWSSTIPASVVQNTPETANEFPTAAEVAQGKLSEKPAVSQAAAEKKQSMAADADAFRGVHLGPNVHHWDEDEEDDSNFLDDVIQFEDGRQYTVQSTQETSNVLVSQPPSEAGESSGKPEDHHGAPVSKEERFADDFDRSWPPSRPTKQPADSGQQPALSPSTSNQSLHSPQDSSRVLFNERSNRLEPYSSSRFSGPPRDSYFPRRGSRSDIAASPTEIRNGREGPVQLLQKQGHSNRDQLMDDRPPRGRGNGDRSGFNDTSRFRDRDGPRRDFAGPSHNMARAGPNGYDQSRPRDYPERNGGPPDRSRRISNASAPHLSPLEPSREGRQLPPHLSGAHAPPHMWRTPSTSERPRRLSTASSVSAQHPPQSPAPSQTPLSPALGEPPAAPTPVVDIDEVRKAAMQSAAERARLRRQQEEEEREKERERARKKAAEIEAKLKMSQEKAATENSESVESQVVSIIESAVRSVTHPPDTSLAVVPEESSTPLSQSTTSKPSNARAPSVRGAPRPIRQPSADGVSHAAGADSWRSKAAPPTPAAEFQPKFVQPPPPAPPPPTMPVHVDHLSLVAGENLEVVDFSEHGKLIGAHVDNTSSVEPASISATTNGTPHRLPRPVATDFFHDQEDLHVHQQVDNTPSHWRRRPSASHEQPPQVHYVQTPVAEDQPSERETRVPSSLRITTAPASVPSTSSPTKPSESSNEASRSHADHGHGDYGQPLKSPQTPYREAPMAALNDTMARIKGALAGMHKPEPKQKWLPPALRATPAPGDVSHRPPRHHVEHDEYLAREVFDVTSHEPPRSPKPAWNQFLTKLPRTSQGKEPVAPKRLRSINTYSHTRLDVSSLVPPSDNMRRRGLGSSLDDFLFSKPSPIRGQPKIDVKLPTHSTDSHSSQLVVKLPPKPIGVRNPTTGAFGRNREADGSHSWRKPPPSHLRNQQDDQTAPQGEGLDTVSRSPPPEMPSVLNAHLGQPRNVTESATIAAPVGKTKSQPKVADGPAVSFYRDSPIEAPGREASPAVKFIVNSELEDSSVKPSEVPSQGSNARGISAPSFPAPNVAPVKGGLSEVPLRTESLSSSKDPIVEFRKGNPVIQAPITPPTHSGNLPSLTWAAQREALKDSPSRPPDPELLKAVWSNTSNKPEGPAVNSLQGFTDDLNAPLTIQGAKMEDLPTPPPQTAAQASRMSIMHDITRTFQQVPESSGTPHSASLGSQPLPPVSQPLHSTPSSSQRPSQLPPSLPGGMRMSYAGYPSPMMSSPSPTLVYPQAMTPSPIPQPMMASGHYPPPPPMWVPVPNGHPGMMRPMASPYGAQLMPYPSAGQMYPHPPNMQGHAMPSSPGVQGRMLSPSGTQSQLGQHPMYATSPVMMHAMPAMSAPNQSYPGSAQPRGPPPPRGMYDHHMSGTMQSSASYVPPQSPAYPSVQPPNMFVRPTW